MRSISTILAAAVLACGASSSSHAGIGITGRAGTLGLGIEVTQSLVPFVNVRGGVNWLDCSFGATESGNHYDVDLKLKSFSALVDLHPIPLMGFRLTGGIVFNSNGLEMQTDEISGSITIGGEIYTDAQAGTLIGNVDFEATAPYFGIGWGNAASRRIGLAIDLGVAFQGSPQVELSATGTLANTQEFMEELRAEEAELQDSLDGFKYYPVISVGLSFKITP